MTVGIAAAGSGGHVYPALAVAEVLVSRGLPREDIIFFGGDRMEASVVPAAGYPFVGVDIHGIRRSLSLDNLTLPLKVRTARNVIVETIDSKRILAMVVFGGYVSGPAALAAGNRKIPLVVHEANAVPGVANRLIARRADTVFAAFAPALGKLPMAEVVGSPLRSGFEQFDREGLRVPARERYGIDSDATVLAVIGGSLGAVALNDLAIQLATRTDRWYHIVHVTGPDHVSQVAAISASVERWLVKGYEDDVPMLYAASDLVLSRGGAMTVAELHATRTPAVIVPLPAGGAYQGLNAADASAAGGFVVLDQSEPDVILDTVQGLLADDDRLEAMSAALADAPHLEAARIVADRILEVHRG
ncbi:MAG: undecaprenyldiphospho-muramoylpentapeptide beta-N-acetylglucosaminyltransferase [Acidimicrobiia bacterium]|nr:MAG: undecaprenyldiphospho-muramoylpentapeptide beta-N-acetylglucosaminyltransferase [Acidimicrobiia bacterium]